MLLGGRLPSYDATSGAVRNGPTPGNRKNSSGGGTDIQLDIDRIFAKKVTVSLMYFSIDDCYQLCMEQSIERC